MRIAIALLGFDGEVKIEPADTADVNDSVRRQNPLGKIPVVIAEDGTTYYDSRVILDYLDDRAGGGKIVPRQPKERLAALRLSLCGYQVFCFSVFNLPFATLHPKIEIAAMFWHYKLSLVRISYNRADSIICCNNNKTIIGVNVKNIISGLTFRSCFSISQGKIN